MRWLKRDMWKIAIAVSGMLLLLVLMVWVPVSVAGAYEGASGLATPVTGTVQATPTEDATLTALNKEKLKGEIIQQQQTENWLWSNGAAILSSFFSTLIIVIGALIAFWRWRGDQRTEQEKRVEERFQQVVEGLGSERTEAKVGAAITLYTFLQPGYERFYRQTFDLAVAHLRLRKADASVPEQLSSSAQALIIPKGFLLQELQLSPAPIPLDSLSQALITVFKEFFPLARKELKKVNAQFDPQQLDATDVRLDNAYLEGADLAQAWLARAALDKTIFRDAHLEGINLRLASLQGADLRGADLRGANLRWAQLKKADLRDTKLKKADLRGARLEGANLLRVQLKGASLIGAQLEGTILIGAQLQGADLVGANPEDATSLKNTKMNGVIGLTSEQQERCIKKGAIFDDVQQANSS